MHEILLIVAPVAGLVLLGFVAAKLNCLPEAAIAGLPAFAFKVTMPALIFRAFLSVNELPSAPEAMIYVYFGTVAIIWVLISLLTVALLRRPAADAAPISMATSFSNSVMLGLPLSLSAFGPESTISAAIIIAIDTPLMWLVAVTQIEFALAGERRFSLAALRPVIIRLFTNPIILATLAGVSGRFAGLELSGVPERFIDLLAGAAVPVALFAMGMTLSTFSLRGQTPTLIVMTVFKLLLMPMIVVLLAHYVWPLPPVWFATAVLFAALPVGANPFLFAAQYERAQGTLSASIAVTTMLSLVTVSAVLYLLKNGYLISS